MNMRSIVLAVTCCMLTLVGCSDEKQEKTSGNGGLPISFKVRGVSGRTDLEPGFKLGIFADEPVYANNVPLTVQTNGDAVPGAALKWKLTQSKSVRFYAYAPYDSSFTGKETVDIAFPTDQSTSEKMLKGNLLTASAKGNKNDPAVEINLKHAMTAMIVSFDNRTGEKIDSLTVRGFKTHGLLDFITGDLTAAGTNNIIKPMQSSDGEDMFCFIYVPQDVSPQFDVKMESGKVITIAYIDGYCHEYPGSIVLMTNILLTESMLNDHVNDAHLIPMKGVNLTQWVQNGIPKYQNPPTYITLSELSSVEPDSTDDNFFVAYLKKVTVTAVDRTNTSWLGVILEDSTCAIHVWTNNNSTLEVGNTIVGPIMGLMDKPSANEFHISNFYTEYATIGKADSLPRTDASIGNVLQHRDEYEYRRVMFKDVTLKKNFQGDMAVFVQDSIEFNVVCTNINVRLAEGVTGDLIGFPVWSGSDFTVMVYDTKQFDSFSKDPVGNAFTDKRVCGLYDLSSSANGILYGFSGVNSGFQLSVRHYENGRSQQVSHLQSNESHFFYVYDCPGTPVVGHSYNVAFNVSGTSGQTGYTLLMDCVKVDKGVAWFMDRKRTKGLILAL